jgi:hypothetical protein
LLNLTRDLVGDSRLAIVPATFSFEVPLEALAAMPAALREQLEDTPLSDQVTCDALLDTGASHAVITPELKDQLCLVTLDSRRVAFYDDEGRLQEREEDTYFVGVTVGGDVSPLLLAVCRPMPPEQPYEAILGTPFLARYRFGWNTPVGRFTLQGPVKPTGN